MFFARSPWEPERCKSSSSGWRWVWWCDFLQWFPEEPSSSCMSFKEWNPQKARRKGWEERLSFCFPQHIHTAVLWGQGMSLGVVELTGKLQKEFASWVHLGVRSSGANAAGPSKCSSGARGEGGELEATWFSRPGPTEIPRLDFCTELIGVSHWGERKESRLGNSLSGGLGLVSCSIYVTFKHCHCSSDELFRLH